MKGNFSRDNYQPKDRFSGVFQVQGGMVTDADLREQAQIARGRTDQLGSDTSGSGVPLKGGAVDLSGGLPALTEGVVYAEGVRGYVEASGNLTNGLSLYEQQVDFPFAPPLPESGQWILYADVWQRTVSPLENSLISDPGLHGAETALRQKTTTQIKFLPAALASLLGISNGPFPKRGRGELSITPVDPETIADDCDPCADVVAAEQTVVNSLFRIEVVHVFGSAQNPDHIRLAWSDENASAIAPANVNSEDFGRSGAVYEFFHSVTEKQLGVHEQNNLVNRSSFGPSLNQAESETPSSPSGENWPYVRRWSGTASVNFNTHTVEQLSGANNVILLGKTVSITVDAFTAHLDFDENGIVAGDYWLIETRRLAEEPIRVVNETPLGIEHHYCPLFGLSNGNPVELTDEQIRRLSFPTLANLPATHIGFDNHCQKLYAEADNVQEALDNLCDISAADIAFDASGCRRLFDSTDNVQDALINLCKADFGNERLLRLLHDWGVVCGVIPSLKKAKSAMVAYTSGVILDRIGELGDVSDTVVDLNKLVGTSHFHFESLKAFAAQLRLKQVCLALAISEGGKIEPHLVPKLLAFGPKDPTFLSVFKQCMEKKPPFNFDKDYSDKPQAERKAIDKVIYGAGKPKLAASQRLNSKEQIVTRKYNNEVIEEYKTFVNDDETVKKLEARIQEIDLELKPEEATGEVRESRYMQREASVYRAIYEIDIDRLRRCLCNALIPRCPTPGDAPYLVPIACLTGFVEAENIIITEVCTASCRKQAISWRMATYYTSEIIETFTQRIANTCCPPLKENDNGGVIIKDHPWLEDIDIREDINIDKVNIKIDEMARIITGRKSPSGYRVKPDINDLGIDQAKIALKGDGIDVSEVIDASDEAAIDKIRESTVGLQGSSLVLDAGQIGPGDKVALIVQDGIAIDYVKLETGSGKFLYEAKANVATDISGQLGEDLTQATDMTNALKEQIAAAVAATQATKVDWDTIRTQRDDFVLEMDQLGKSLHALQAERETIEIKIDAARVELAQITEAQMAVIENAAKERDSVVGSIRRETPIAAVAKENTQFQEALLKKGITNIGQFAAISDADLRTVAKDSKLTLAVVREFKKEAVNRINAPFG